MQTSSRPKRQAGIEAPYHLLGALAALYAEAEKIMRRDEHYDTMARARDHALECLGHVWQWSESARLGLPVEQSITTFSYIEDVARRIEAAHSHVNAWTVIWRLLRIIYRSEQRWQRCLQRLAELDFETAKIIKLSDQSRERMESIHPVFEELYGVMRARNDNYAIPQPLVA